MKSRDIIIKLINEGKINGEEAFELINDVIIAEVKEAMETLNQCKSSKNSLTLDKDWYKLTDIVTSNPYTYNTISNNIASVSGSSSV